MFYRPNLPTWERVLRTLFGLALLVVGAFVQPGFLRWSLWGSAIMAVGTAVLAFCPMCAMAGRRLDRGKLR